MLTLREDQVRSIRSGRLGEFKSRLIAHSRKHHPEQTRDLGDDELTELIDQQMLRARDSGFESESQICKFLSLRLELGADFPDADRYEWAQPYLDPRSSLPSGARMQMLLTEGIDRLRRAGAQ